MPRGSSPTLEGLLPHCKTVSLADIKLRDDSQFYFCTGGESLSLLSHSYLPYLLDVGEQKETLGKALNRVAINISNVDNPFSLDAPGDVRKLKMAEVVIRRLYQDSFDPNINEIRHFFTGRAAYGKANQQIVPIDVIPDTTASGTCIGVKDVSPRNGFVFPETPEQSPPGSGDNPGDFDPCFIAGTRVLAPSGELNIEDVVIGDEVYSFDGLRKVVVDKVAKTFVHQVSGYFQLDFENISIFVTPEHRFFSEKDWIKAEHLEIGSTVWRYENFWTKEKLVKKEWINKSTQVYNFHVSKNQTYFANQLAVHNRKFDI